MRFCFVGAHAHVHMVRWYQYFVETGHEIFLISTTEKSPTTFMGLPVYSFPMPRGRYYFVNLIQALLFSPIYLFRLRRMLVKIKPDIIHVHYINDAAFYSLFSGFRPIFLTAWGSDVLISPERSWIRKKVLRYILNKADLITCDAEHMVSKILEYGVNRNKVRIIFFGTDVEKFTPEKRDKSFCYAQNYSPLIISIRNLEPVYDIETFLRSIPLVHKRHPNAQFLIGGSGSLKQKLVELCSSLGVSSKVKFLGAINQSELPVLLASCDIYVSTSLSDGGLAASTAEAMASGLPAIVTDVGNNNEWVVDGVHGFLFPIRNSAVLAEKICLLLDDSLKRLKMGKAGRDIILERNNYRREMMKMGILYKEKLGLAYSPLEFKTN